MLNIYDVAKKVNIPNEYVIPYGSDKAKIDKKLYEQVKNNPNGKLVLVTAITPTKAGEGKTTTSIALSDGLNAIGINSLLCLREPSLGPVFGIKGGATGGGKASVIPVEDINLHFTGDLHALTSSVNLISAVIDNHIFQGNELGIDPNRIVWKRALDMNDRALRSVTVLQDEKKGTPRHDEFVITVASELMAVLCLAKDENDFLERIQKIIVAYTFDNKPVTVKDLKVSHAIMRLMKYALMPNIVQTLEGNPALIHGGPFANIAHGCNSIIATKLGLKLAPIVVTEAGFGADLGAEKFLDIKCQVAGLKPDACVMVATIRALKMHGGQAFDDLAIENVEALEKGVCNLAKHLSNIKKYGLPVVVCINKFPTDTENEVAALAKWCEENNYKYSVCSAFSDGSKGSVDLARKVKETLDNEVSNYHPLYSYDLSIKEKIETIAKEIYGAGEIKYSDNALKQIEEYTAMGFDKTPICMAKTPQSLTDNAKILGAPVGFTISIREVRLSAGANFLVPLTGSIMTMPGLPKIPAAIKMEDEPF